VSVVHHAVETLRRQLRPPLAAALAGACLALLGGCGGSGKGTTSARSPAGIPVSLANCADWKSGTVAERHEKVIQLREFSGGRVGSSKGIQHGPVLDDGTAYKLLQNGCAPAYARAFKLYKIYTRAAAFIGH
jgi:hypothetical protein